MVERIWQLTVYILRVFARSLRVVVPPGLTIGLHRVLFLYRADVDYFGAMSCAVLFFVCIVTMLLLASAINRAASYVLFVRLARRREMIAALLLATWIVTALMALLFIALTVLTNAVPLKVADIIALLPRWIPLFMWGAGFALLLAPFTARRGSNLVAYAFVIVGVIALRPADYAELLPNVLGAFTIFFEPIKQLMSGMAVPPLNDGFNMVIVCAYGAVCIALAAYLLERKDLVWSD